MSERRKPTLEPLVQRFIEPEQERLLRELNDLNTSHHRRLMIGERLGVIGDTRFGVGVRTVTLAGRNLLVPEIDWCSVSPGGEITIEGETFPVRPFSIARYLITYQQFEAFAGNSEIYQDETWWQGMPTGYDLKELITARNQFPNAPRDGVNWYQAIAFCRWLDAQYTQLGWKPDPEKQIRLPTEWEWQWAAQNGEKQWPYPWGEWDEQARANIGKVGINHQSTAVGMYPDGNAACGAFDMAGNLWEWCLNDYTEVRQISRDSGTYKALRGGSFDGNQLGAATISRTEYSPHNQYLSYDHFGLRVVLSHCIEGL